MVRNKLCAAVLFPAPVHMGVSMQRSEVTDRRHQECCDGVKPTVVHQTQNKSTTLEQLKEQETINK